MLLPLALVAAILACGGEDEAKPTSPSATLAPSAPRGMTGGDLWFRGTVTRMNTGCYVDATCSVTVAVKENLGGATLQEGKEVEVIESYGFSIQRCEGQWSETPSGHEVEVLAHTADGGSLAICADDHYFVTDVSEE